MLVDLLDEVAPQLIARVAEALPAATERATERTLARLPELMRGLVEQLRADRLDPPSSLLRLPLALEVAPLVTALHLLKAEVYALIEARNLPATPRQMRIIGDWFANLGEAALATENRRFAAMLDALPDHLLLRTADGEVIYLNGATAESAKALTGLSRQQLLGRKTPEVFGTPELQQYLDSVHARVRRGEAVTDEFLLPSPDGGRWHEHHLRPLFGSDGKVEAIAIASRDIHARKKAESRLQLMSKLGTLAESMEYESVLSAVARLSIPELADWCIIDIVEGAEVRRGTIAHRDPAKAELAEELLRFPPQSHVLPLGRHVLTGAASLIAEIDAGSADSDPVFAGIVRRLGARSAMIVPFFVMGAPVALATFVMTPESGRRHGPDDLALAEEMARRAGQVIENARLHQQLRQSEARFRVALEGSNIAVFEMDSEFRIRWIYNDPLATDRDPVGKRPSEYLPPELTAQLEPIWRRVASTGEGMRSAVHFMLAGRQRHFLVSHEPLHAVGGIAGVTGAIVDVTELKEAEEQLARELGFRERMMGILGHDLRNPVSAVLGLAGLVRLDAGLNDKARESLALIEQAARRMNEMINTLLDFTRLRAGGSLPIDVDELDFADVAHDVAAELRAAHPRRELELTVHGDARGRWDSGRVAQLLANLVANALTHGAPGSPVRISVDGEGGDVAISVSNQGAAIPPELIDRLFEPFQQGSDSSGQRSRGLGLGLFIVREIVRAHAGTIDVQSSDELTRFTVKLPRSAARR